MMRIMTTQERTRDKGPVNVYLHFAEWEAFKELMASRDISPSARIRRYIRAELKKAAQAHGT